MQNISFRSGAVVVPPMRIWLAALWLALLPLLAGASGPAHLLRPAAAPPTLTAINPTSGPTGASLTLTGSNLDAVTSVTFTSGGGTATNAANTYIAGSTSVTGVVVPAGLSLGAYTVTARNSSGLSNGLPFTVTAAPFGVSSFAPASGPAGTLVTITGNQLDLVTGVRFGTGSLTTGFVSQSATSLTVRVPVTSSTGVLTLTNNVGGTATSSASFTYTPRPGGLVATLSPAGPLDVCQPRTLTASAVSPAFATGTGFNSTVNSVAVQADGKVLAVGSFTSYNGTAASRLVRLNADGTLDASFATGTGFGGSTVFSVAVQADGKVLAGGVFNSYNGTGASNLIRLNADGSRDASFATGTGFSSQVRSVAVQADGKVLVGGGFTSYNGTATPFLVRLNADGSRDASFATGTGFSSTVFSVAVQADGKVLVGGQFTSYNGTAASRLVRLNADGTLDASFATGTGFDDIVFSVAVQADGKVLAGGYFTSYNGTASQNRLVRLNTDGSRDAGFATGTGFNDNVLSVAVQADGKVLAGGIFTSYNGTTANYLARLNADGSRDTGFATGTGFGGSSQVRGVAVQADGKALVGGTFTRYNGTTGQNNLVRLNADGSLNSAATPVSGASFTFSPGGTTTNPLMTSTAGSYTATASLNGETSVASNAVVLTACPVPTITDFNPKTGPAGTSVTITGSQLDLVTGVRFGTGSLTTGFVSQSATSLTVRVPVTSSTGVLTLTNNVGGTATSSASFTYTPRPGGLVATLSPAGPLDVCQPRTLTATAASPAFATGTGFSDYLYSVAVQADGKVLAGGSFSSYNGTAGQNNLVRLNADGTLDASFATGTGFSDYVYSVAVQADGKVLAGGDFTTYNGTTANRLVRLNADGTLDASFATGTGFNSTVRSVAVQADGKVLAGGDFTTYNGTTANSLVRLNADGTLDASFATGTGFNSIVLSVAVQADGKVLVGGYFNSYNGTAGKSSLVRLNADGTLDASFATGTGFPIDPGFESGVNSLAVQADGKVLVGGSFSSYNGTATKYLVRLNADGTLDASFATGTGFDYSVSSVAVQADGKVLVGGYFTAYNGTAGQNYLVRLNANGTIDAGFATGTGFSGGVLSVAVQADGKVLAGGYFNSYNGTAGQNNLVRLTATGSLNATATPVSGASFTFSPGNTTTNPLVTSTPGSYTATASLNGETSAASNAVVLTACPVPVLTGITPGSGPVGSSVTLTGSDLTNVVAVTFGGSSNNTVTTGFLYGGSGSSLTVTVPAGASTGPVTVTTNGGTSNGILFTVTVPDLTVDNTNSTAAAPYSIADGTYGTITVASSGYAQLGGAVVVNTALNVSGTLDTYPNCQPLTGSGSFTLAAGATLVVCSLQGITQSDPVGAVQMTGLRSFSPEASYVYTTGGDPQQTGDGLPTTVRNLTSLDAQPLTLSQPLAVTQVLTLAGASNLDLGGQPLTLRSDANGTALVVNAGTGRVLGTTATLQRHIETNTAANGYRHYASPMMSETVNTLATAGYAPDFGGAAAYNSSATPGTVTPFPTVFGYEQNRIATTVSNYDTFNKGWQAALSGEAMPVGKGYAVQAPGAALVDFTGTAFSGPLAVGNLLRTGPADGWHLLGNPYPAPLDWSTMSIGTTAAANLQNMDGALYVFQSSGPYTGTYRTYLANMPGGNSPIVPAGSGFFVRTTTPGTPGTVRFTNDNRVTTFDAQPAFGRSTSTLPTLTLALAGAAGTDALTLYANPAAAPAVEAQYDAVKLANPSGLNLASLTATGEALAIDGRPTLAGAVPLQVGLPAAGTYTLTAATLANLTGTRAELVDNLTGTRTLLVAGAAYTFTSATTTAPGRFWLNLTPAAAPLATAAALEAQVLAYPNPTHGTLTVLRPAGEAATGVLYNSVGQVVRTVALPTTETTLTLTGLPAGVYALRLTVGGHTLTRRVVLN
ncbi:T9SS type A sorting domain-containing protein [Hymenobacter sp. ASUV-10]|uniref:T9SS type A sorting domain-containing protein n=1 Tax=Hymenobacter aranciens TaxID=3063996 RepID=A0ABT9B5Q9_9BACT|nr:T9SS type A sorting domain-containing protein [Hymenobacter sp. ASUV-10]MDO7873513.1 T9SS type A sorting domain-containing protein [Hymenobacter sp. ASUV-10]